MQILQIKNITRINNDDMLDRIARINVPRQSQILLSETFLMEIAFKITFNFAMGSLYFTDFILNK